MNNGTLWCRMSHRFLWDSVEIGFMFVQCDGKSMPLKSCMKLVKWCCEQEQSNMFKYRSRKIMGDRRRAAEFK